MYANLNCQPPKLIPVFLHNLSRYDSHLFITKLRTINGEKIKCIPNNEENYISFNKEVIADQFCNKQFKLHSVRRELRFIDTFRFMSSSLEKLISTITACGKCVNCNLKNKPCQTPTDANLKKNKSLFDDNESGRLNPELYKRTSLNGVNNLRITLREKIDRGKLEYIFTHADDFDLGSRMIKGCKVDKAGQITLLKDYLTKVNSLGEVLRSITNSTALADIGRHLM